MLLNEIDLINELDNVSKIHQLDRDDIDTIMIDFSKRILPALRIERLNVWLFNKEKDAIISIGEYDTRTRIFSKNSVLSKKDFPVYFNALQQNKIIIAEDIHEHAYTKEFSEIYSKPNDIYSLLDIPLRISGELIGVMCFEKTGEIKKFSNSEISFCLSLSFVFASNMETRHRRAAQHALEKMVADKEVLLKELNHRVKNNFAILISLLRISKDKSKTQESKQTLMEYEQRIFSMLKIHDMLTQNRHYSLISISEYLEELVREFKATYPQFESAIAANINDIELEINTKKIIHLGLIVSEILLNSIKHASESPDYKIIISLQTEAGGAITLIIGDNGKGFDFKKLSTHSTLGLSLIKDLTESLEMQTEYPKDGQPYYKIWLQK